MNEEKLKKTIERNFKEKKLIGLAIAFHTKGKDFYFEMGDKSVLGNDAVTKDTLFEIASITKIFTASLIAVLIAKKKISLQSTLGEIYKGIINIHPSFYTITISQLLSHTSGLPRIPDEILSKMSNLENPYADILQADFYELFEKGIPLGENIYLYSNFGFGILGDIVQLKTGLSYDIAVEELLNFPLSLTNTKQDIETIVPLDIALGYTWLGTQTPYWKNNAFAGAGCLFSTSSDMLKFIKANIYQDTSIGNILSSTHRLQTKNVAMGWHKYGFLLSLIGFRSYLWHNGMNGGFSSYLAVSPKKKSGFILLTNKAISIDDFGIELLSYL
ncbi:MAG: serine hydrolase domain-containing protein [Bacteroidota bacterium]